MNSRVKRALAWMRGAEPRDEREPSIRDANAIHNHYHGPVNVNHIRQANNPNFGANYGHLNQVMYEGGTAAGTAAGRASQTTTRVDIFSLLNPVLDASHTRNMKHSPPNSQCLPGTRKEVIQEIRAWGDSDDLETNPHILWIFGYAGCGKSAIAHEVAKLYAEHGRLAACFVFFRGSGDRSTAVRFATTVASQIASALPETEAIIESTLRKNPGLLHSHTSSLSDQFKYLVLRPILTVTSNPSAPFLIILDGVDECRDRDDVSSLIESMIRFFERHPNTPVRFLIASRVEDHLHQVLHSSSQVQLLNLVRKTSDADIAAALTAAIQREARGQVLSRHGPWPSVEEKLKLVKHIGGSFIFMSTIVKRLFDSNIQDGLTPMERLPLVLSMNPDFDDLYKGILMPCQHFPHFTAIMATIALAFRPLSVAELAEVLDIKTYDVANVLVNMNAIIQVPGDDRTPITLWHTSLRDYLTAEDRSGPLFAQPSHHRWLAKRCISLAVASANAAGSLSSGYPRNYAIDHLAKMAEMEVSQNPNSVDHELQGALSALQMPIYKDGRTALDVACHGRHWKLVRELIISTADVNVEFKESLDETQCALHAACYYNESEMIELLLEKGADPNIISSNDGGGFGYHGTPLVFAAFNGDLKLATRLLECGADPNLRGGSCGTALQAACVQDSLEIVNLLLDHGADPDARDVPNGSTLLHMCAQNGDCDDRLARALLKHGADPNSQDEYGSTPLHEACVSGNVKLVECLLEFEADASVRNENGETALQVAQDEDHEDVVRALRRHGVSQ